MTSQMEFKQISECGLADICWAHAMLVRAEMLSHLVS